MLWQSCVGWRSTGKLRPFTRSAEHASISAHLPSASGDRVIRVPPDGARVNAARRSAGARVALAAHGQSIIAAFSAECLHCEGEISIKSNHAILVVAILPRVVVALPAIAALLAARSINYPSARRGRRWRWRRWCWRATVRLGDVEQQIGIALAQPRQCIHCRARAQRFFDLRWCQCRTLLEQQGCCTRCE